MITSTTKNLDFADRSSEERGLQINITLGLIGDYQQHLWFHTMHHTQIFIEHRQLALTIVGSNLAPPCPGIWGFSIICWMQSQYFLFLF